MNNQKICVVIPCYNVIDHIDDVIRRIDFKIIDKLFIIDDCCCAGSEDEHQFLLNNMARFADVATSQDINFSAG